MASVRKIAAEAKVSPATVSRYFTGRESISPALSNRIEEALRRMGETAADKRPLKPVILILLTHLRYSFFSRAIQELLEREYSEHYTFLLVRYDPDYPEGTRGVVNRVHPVGVIYFEEEIDSGILRYIQGSGVRTVMCGGVAVDEGSQMIHVNDIRAAYDGTRYLLDLGHRDILFLSDDISKIGAGYQRIAGSRKAMEERGLFLPGEAVICGSVMRRSGPLCGRKCVLPPCLLSVTIWRWAPWRPCLMPDSVCRRMFPCWAMTICSLLSGSAPG